MIAFPIDESCVLCERLQLVFLEVAQRLQNNPDCDIRFVRIDTEGNEDITRTYGVERLPTVLMFRPKERSPAKYQGRITTESLGQAVLSASVQTLLTLERYDDFAARYAFYDEGLLLAVVDKGRDGERLRSEVQRLKRDFHFVRAYLMYQSEELRQRFNIR